MCDRVVSSRSATPKVERIFSTFILEEFADKLVLLAGCSCLNVETSKSFALRGLNVDFDGFSPFYRVRRNDKTKRTRVFLALEAMTGSQAITNSLSGWSPVWRAKCDGNQSQMKQNMERFHAVELLRPLHKTH